LFYPGPNNCPLLHAAKAIVCNLNKWQHRDSVKYSKVLRSYLFGLKGHREGLQNFDDYFIQFMWKDRVFAIRSTAHWLGRCGTNLCANIN
jgi:hypothetical protein